MKRIFGMSVFAILFLTVGATAQMPAGAAPIPAEIQKAKTVFISNTGSIFYSISHDRDRLYVSFYRQMQAAGGFKIVNDPQKADLILEPRYFPPPTAVAAHLNPNTPVVQLSIYDPATHVLLWTLNQEVEPCALQKTCDRNLESALTSLMMQISQLRSQAWVSAN